jgi:hypothetical protein
MSLSVGVFKNSALAAVMALAFSSASAAVISAGNMTPTTSVGFGQQNVPQGDVFEYLYVFNVTQAVGGVYSTINWTPAESTASATFFKSNASGVQDGSTLAAFSPTMGSNLMMTYQGIVSGYYTVRVLGTAASLPSANTLISGQASPIPVPASLALLGLGLVGLSLVRGRRSV